MSLVLSDIINIFIALVGAVAIFVSAYYWAINKSLNSFIYFLICLLIFSQFTLRILGEYKIFNADILLRVNNIPVVPLTLYLLIFILLILFTTRISGKN